MTEPFKPGDEEERARETALRLWVELQGADRGEFVGMVAHALMEQRDRAVTEFDVVDLEVSLLRTSAEVLFSSLGDALKPRLVK